MKSKILNEIKQYDPSFNNMLENRMKKAAPRLYTAEAVLLFWLHTGHLSDDMTISESIREIQRASVRIPDYEISIDDELDSKKIFSATQIKRERFFYLSKVMQKAEKCGI